MIRKTNWKRVRRRNERKPRGKERARIEKFTSGSRGTYLRISGFGREIEWLIGRRGAILMSLHPDEGCLPRR